MARVGVDIDGVMFDFQASLQAYMERFGDRDFPAPTRWEFYEDWGLNTAEFLSICHAAADEGVLFTNGSPMDDAANQLCRLRDAGHEIVLVTDRTFGKTPQASIDMTQKWLLDHNIPYHELAFTAIKTDVPMDYMIDDKPSNYQDLYGVGVDVWLRRRPWNEYFIKDARYVESLEEYVNYVIATAYGISTDYFESLKQKARDNMEQIHEYQQEEIRKTSATGGQKGVKLARFDLIPTSPMWELAELYGKGAIKYADRNWELGYPWGESYAALQRHAQLFWAGESYDLHKDDCPADCSTHTLKHHLASVIFHCMALMEWERTHPEFDDRVK